MTLELVVAAALAAVLMAAVAVWWRRRRLALYVPLPGSAAYPHPFSQQDCTASMFVLQADWDQLCKTVDRWLNVPLNRKYRYVPLFPTVFLTSLAIPRITCKTPPDCNIGFMPENDLTLSVPLVALKGGVVPTHLAMGFAYLLVDEAATMYTGRENFGYRKQFGVLTMNDKLRGPVSATTKVFKEHSPATKLEAAEVIRINLPDNLPATPRCMFTDGGKFLETLAGMFPSHHDYLGRCGLKKPFDLLKQFIHPTMQVAFLKQLRDVEDPARAAYQALVESPSKVTAFRGGGLLDSGFTVTLTNYASYPMISDLGLVSDSGKVESAPVQTFTPLFGFWADFDFDLEEGRVIAEHGGNRRMWL